MVGFSFEIWHLCMPLVVVGLFLAICLVIATFMFFLLLLERRSVLPIRRTAPRGPQDRPSYNIVPALAMDFQSIGMYADARDENKGRRTILLSQDRTIVLQLLHSKMDNLRLMTRFADGGWLLTAKSLGEPDFTGLLYQQADPKKSFYGLLAMHRNFITASGREATLLSPEEIPAALAAMERRRGQILVSMGLARWRSPSCEAWSYNFRGARAIVRMFLRIAPKAIKSVMSRSEPEVMLEMIDPTLVENPMRPVSPLDRNPRAPSAMNALIFGLLSIAVLTGGVLLMMSHPFHPTGVHRTSIAFLVVTFGTTFVIMALAALALICGIRAYKQIHRNPLLTGKRLALFGIGYGGLILVTFAFHLVTWLPIIMRGRH
jgi:hypothetical protein